MLELLVVLVVMGILGAISMGMLRSDKMAIQQAATIVAGQVSRARLEAIKNNENTGIWFTGGYSYTPDANGNYTLTQNPGGYKICVDANRDTACNSTEKVVNSLQFGKGEMARVYILSAGSDGVIFNSRGIPVQGDVFLFLGTKNWSEYKLIYINSQGRASIL